ncbi:MAG TPA: calcium/sodium antiporter [Burkholderiaceae bacterium]|nr:calcium/sodium antiporter [Burkholderiaceae bacterium]
MLIQVVLFCAGLVALIAGAELLVRGASKLAITFGMSPLVVGLTVVAFGTSAPEVAVSVGAVYGGRTDVAIGNVVGSNIFNVLLILGVSALIAPLVVARQVIRQEVPLMIGTSVLLVVLLLDGHLSRFDAAMLAVLMVAYTAFLVVQSRRDMGAARNEDTSDAARKAGGSAWDRHWSVQLLLIAGGLALLVLGSQWLVGAAVVFARALGISDVVVGLTIVAAGTSLPEVATSVMAAVRGERDIAVGNVVGSNMFNIFACLGIAGLVATDGLPVPPSVLNFDLWVMVAVAFACLPVFLTGREIARWEGGLFLGYYVAYTAYLILASTEHDALEAYSAVMMSFVIPLTVVTLFVMLVRSDVTARAPR